MTNDPGQAALDAVQALERARQEAYDRGYADAQEDVRQLIEQLNAQLPTRPEPMPPEPAPASTELPPKQSIALAYLRQHPGVTAWAARGDVGSSAFYKLAARGLARREGSRFFAVE